MRNCPNTPDSWKAAAIRKNCSTNVYGSESAYHCLETEEKQLVEVCVRPLNLLGKFLLTLLYIGL